MITATLSVFLVLFAFGHCGKDKPVFSEEINELIQTVHDACVEITGVAEEDITNCEKGIFKEDTKLKCYMYCLLEESSMADDVGNVDFDMFFGFLPPAYVDRAVKMINACRHLDTPDKDKCQRAFDVNVCTYEKDPDFYFLL